MFSAFKRAKLLKIVSHGNTKVDAAIGREAVTDFMQTIAAKDDRRLRWIVERACDSTADSMDRIERDLVVQEHYARAEAMHENYVRQETIDEARASLARLEEDFRFLYGLKQVLDAAAMETFGEGIAAWFRAERKASDKPAKIKK